ncbi:hypothetical protein [Candidatus Cardinium hertigii]|uniref:hypothetical protein n=1 Tax=Candidatus Cardinium hertigii TaxID=247481 RepID=UPI003D7D3FAD
MNDSKKNKPTLREDTTKNNNRLSRKMDKAEANRCAAAQIQLGPVSDIKDTIKPKKSHSNNNLLKENFCLSQTQTNLEKLTAIGPFPNVLNESCRSISQQLINYPCSSLTNINSKPLNISDLEGAYTELFEAVNTETLYTNLFYNQEKAIYIISGIDTDNEDNAKNLFLNALEQSERQAIYNHIAIVTRPYCILSKNKDIQLVNSPFTEKTFKELCDKHTYKKIYWIKWNGSQCMILQKIYNPNFYTDRNFNKVIINNKAKMIYGVCRTLTQGTEDKFIFSGIIDNDYDALGKLLGVEPSIFNEDKIFVKQDLQESRKIFDNFSDTAHWLEVEGNENNKQIIWRNSKGSLDSLLNTSRKNKNATNEITQLFFGKINKEYRPSVYPDSMISPLTQSMCSLLTEDESLYSVPSTSNNDQKYPTLVQTNERYIA